MSGKEKIRGLCLRLEKARNFFENKEISDVEKARYESVLDELVHDIDEELSTLKGEDLEFGIELLERIYGGKEI